MGAIETEAGTKDSPLTLTREPKSRKGPGTPGSLGDQALTDAITAIVIGWALLFLLAFSLRKHNV